MSADDAGHDEPAELQFDRVETGRAREGTALLPSVRCRLCKKAIGDEYFVARRRTFCRRCSERLMKAAATPPSPSQVALAVLLGLGAMLAGAAAYYVVYAVMHVQFGIVAIAAGYLVGYAVRAGSGRRGGLWLQVLAVVLAYLSVDLAYVLIAMQQHAAVSSALLVTLPIVAVMRTLPLGLITALIIGIALRQAWTMTAPFTVKVSGPYRIGSRPAPMAS